MPFRQHQVDVRSIGDKDWILVSPLEYEGKVDHFLVPAGTETDFASVPRPFVWFLPTYGPYTKAAILHDYLWRHAVPKGDISLADADGIFRRAMRELRVPFLRRWMMWAAVRLGALIKPGGTRRWIRESWRVLPVSLLALPITLPPALLVLLALGVFFVVEMIFYLPLAAVKAIRVRRGTPQRQEVNAPSLDLKLS